MSASEILRETLKELRAARKAMLSARWTLSLEKEDTTTRERAAKESMRVHHAIQKLENAELASIRDRLLENEDALTEGRDKLAKALTDIKKTTIVLNAVSSFLSIIERIVNLLAV